MKDKKITVGVLMGGPSSEREVSLVTGQAVLNGLDKTKYKAVAIEMTKDCKFNMFVGKKKVAVDFVNKHRNYFDIIFIALHGSPGEDGGVQGLFETLGIKYTGPGVLASALAMNKVFAGQIYLVNHLPHPEFINVKKEGWKKYSVEVLKEVKEKIGYPCVVKPVDQGSAVGVSIVQNEKELVTAFNKTVNKYPWLMVQKFIKGQEGTCGVVEKNGQMIPLPPTHIKPNLGSFYDYKSKYKAGGSTHICPADFSQEINERMQVLAQMAHKALRCVGMSRTDMFVEDNGNIWIIETNTIPGMTATSLFPESAKAAGISFPKLLDMVVTSGLKR